MKKKILITSLFILSIFILTSCSDIFKLGGGFYEYTNTTGNNTITTLVEPTTTTNSGDTNVTTNNTGGAVDPVTTSKTSGNGGSDPQVTTTAEPATTTTTTNSGGAAVSTTTTATNNSSSSNPGTPTKLETPVLNCRGDTYSWKAIPNADYYEFHYANNVKQVRTTSYTFSPLPPFSGEIYVVACSNNSLYTKSDKSNSIWISVLA